MQRISTLNRVLNLFGAGKDGFKNGDLASGIVPTEFNAAWCNSVQEELANVVEAGGIVPSGASLSQLLAALRSVGVFQTAAQFDSTTKAATTAFVQRALGNYQASYPVASAVTMTAADVGKNVTFNAGGSVVLPIGATLIPGASIIFGSTVNGSTVSRQGTDLINTLNAGTVTSFTLDSGDTLLLTWNGGQWVAFGGSVQLKYAAGFSASTAVSGYQKLPSGLILQWGISSAIPQGGSAAIAFPIAFPNACRGVYPTTYGQSSGTTLAFSVGSSSYGLTSASLWNNGTNGSITAIWFAIGF